MVLSKRKASLNERDSKRKRSSWYELAAAARFGYANLMFWNVRLSV
ncbi:50S ribosomal protein L32 [Candidatus Hodgkinia cicadicola]|nr:50S ribosomal protein L32 [Candidatus Hodgkinia cicadicola]